MPSVPIGIQIAGRTYDDISVFRAAAAFTAARPWFGDPTVRPAFEGQCASSHTAGRTDSVARRVNG